MKCQGKKVYVGLSGGVDSSVSAGLLKQAGYDVTGVFIRIWQPEWTECSMKDDRVDAMRVCAHLGIPFKEIDLTEEYKREVVEYMISEYAKGRTPNPDVACNKSVKFGKFFDWAIAQGADFVATGHYTQIENANLKMQNDNAKSENTKILKIAVDSSKDQTYFLWTLTQKQLSRTLFPVGGFLKSDVRKLAKKFELPTSEKKDSQGLCFVGRVDIKDFLSRYVPEKQGDVLDIKGKIVGWHRGAHFFTIGERHGFTITTQTHTDSKPHYVIFKDIRRNTITVASKSLLHEMPKKSVYLSNINWISGKKPDSDKIYEGQIRYHGKHYKISIEEEKINFHDIPEALALGQSFVIFEGNNCLGGGVLESFES